MLILGTVHNLEVYAIVIQKMMAPFTLLALKMQTERVRRFAEAL